MAEGEKTGWQARTKVGNSLVSGTMETLDEFLRIGYLDESTLRYYIDGKLQEELQEVTAEKRETDYPIN